MMKIAKVMVVLATLAVYRSRAVIHTLKYFYYRSSGVPNFPEFSGAALLDGAEIVHYDSDTRRAEPRQEWMENLSAGDPQYWERETAKFLGAQQSYKARTEILKPRFNQTGGVHIFQNMYGCEWDDETDERNGFDQWGYDGEDLISFNLTEEIWVAAKPEAEIITHTWNQSRAEMEHWKNYLTQIPSITSNTTAIVGVAVAVAVLVLGTIAGFIVYRQKKGKCPRAEGHPEVKEPLRPISA